MADDTRFPIVGVGASAGGIPALEGFFSGLPADSGLAVVIVTHLSPDRESLLHEVVARFTKMPVMIAAQGARVDVDHVYVMPANTVLSIESGVLQVRPSDPAHRERKPIDVFFASLGEDQGEFSVGVVLSGGDGDGTLGAKAIKESGGLTLAQTADGGSGPRHPDMPQSAILSGTIDISVPVDEMGPRLIAFARSFDVLDGITQDDSVHEDAALEGARIEICGILTSHTGHDFAGYKTKTFFRRVRRRMQVNQLSSITGYVEHLKSSADEVISADSELKPASIPINYRPPFRFEAGHDSDQLSAGFRL